MAKIIQNTLLDQHPTWNQECHITEVINYGNLVLINHRKKALQFVGYHRGMLANIS